VKRDGGEGWGERGGVGVVGVEGGWACEGDGVEGQREGESGAGKRRGVGGERWSVEGEEREGGEGWGGGEWFLRSSASICV